MNTIAHPPTPPSRWREHTTPEERLRLTQIDAHVKLTEALISPLKREKKLIRRRVQARLNRFRVTQGQPIQAA